MDLIDYDPAENPDGQEIVIIKEEAGLDSDSTNIVNLSPQFYLISSANGFAANTSNQILIAPKVVQGTLVNKNDDLAAKVPIDRIPSTNHNGSASASTKSRKRDERRRLTHNEVERRRRDKINQWIEKLGQLIPVDGEPVGCLPLDRPNISSADSASKNEILSKACDYVTALHHKVNTLNECQKESKKINAEAKKLRDANAQLIMENAQLRNRLQQMGESSSS